MRYLPLFLAAAAVACVPKQQGPVTEPVPAISMPEVGALPAFTPPIPVVSQLENGASLWLIEDHQLPLISIRALIPGGSSTDAPDAWGTAALATAMLHESAGDQSTTELSGAWKLLAADFGVSPGQQMVSAALDVGTENLDAALALMSDALLRPQFSEADWERVSRLHVNGLKHARDKAPTLAREIANLHYFGSDHAFGAPLSGTPDTASSVTLDAAKTFHQDMLSAKGIKYVVVGDISLDEATAALNKHLGELGGETEFSQDLATPEAVAGPRLLLVDMPGAAQTAIRVVGPGLSVTAENLPEGELATLVIGGSFTSRLNNLLREQKGYTYGARASLFASKQLGTFVASTSVRTATTADALTDLLGVLKASGSGFSVQEVNKAHAQMLSRNINALQTRSGQANSYLGRASMELSHDGWADELLRGLKADQEQMQSAANTLINPDNMLIVLVGDKSEIAGPLEEAGFTFEEVSPLP